MKYKKFKELTKNQKIFRIINLSLMLAIFITCIALIIYYAMGNDPDGKRLSGTIVILVACIIPFMLELIFRFRFNSVIFLGYEIYLAVAGLFGSAFNGYALIPWFDSPVHVLMGYIMAMLGIFVIARLGNYKSFNPWLVAVFCVCFSLAVEVVWEISEWLIDRVCGSTMQGTPVEPDGVPLLWDTIKDLMCNTCGAMLFFLHFVLGKKTKVNLGILAIETELSVNKMIKQENEKLNLSENFQLEDESFEKQDEIDKKS